MPYPLEDDVPLTPRARGNKFYATPRFPLRDMLVGQSFLVPYDDPNCNQGAIANRCHQAGREMMCKFAWRRTPSGIRVWRTE